MKQQFLKEIRSTFGSGGFVCSCSDKKLAEFHQFLECSFPFDDPAKVKKGVACAGKQPEDNVWIVSNSVHMEYKSPWLTASSHGNLLEGHQLNCAQPRVNLYQTFSCIQRSSFHYNQLDHSSPCRCCAMCLHTQ